MIKLEKLIPLEKAHVVDIPQCNIIENWYDEDKGIRTRILQKDGRYFLHEEKANGETSCVEVAVDWHIRADRILFAWTPDDRHIYRVESGGVRPLYDVLRLELDQIKPGDSCSYWGMKLTYLDKEHLRLNDITVSVIADSEYTYALRKKWIRAMDGAAGLYRFLENIAEEYAIGLFPVLQFSWNKIFEFYKAIREEAGLNEHEY